MGIVFVPLGLLALPQGIDSECDKEGQGWKQYIIEITNQSGKPDGAEQYNQHWCKATKRYNSCADYPGPEWIISFHSIYGFSVDSNSASVAAALDPQSSFDCSFIE